MRLETLQLQAINHTLLSAAGTALLLAFALAGTAYAQPKNVAGGFDALPKNAKVVIMPTDIELFSISGGGILEPKADWTEAATKHFKAALIEKQKTLGVVAVELSDKDADEFDEINALHAAVARAIAQHHFGPGFMNLPTKDGKLDWSMGESVVLIKQKTGGDYALFTWVRDSYTSGERFAAMIALAILSRGQAGGAGGQQVGYASLVDLNTGQVLWFNRLLRATGDLREPDKAAETLNALLSNFPSSR